MHNRICFPYKDDEKNIPKFINDVSQVYGRMLDKVSKEIFVNRLLVSLTGNYEYMRNIILYTIGGKKLNNLIQNRKAEHQYIYGAGVRGKRLLELFPDNNWGGFIDKNSTQKSYYGIKIMNLEEFISFYTPGMIIFISNKLEVEEIINDLLRANIGKDDIYVLNDFDQEGTEDIYFSVAYIKDVLETEKVFVDIGCFDGKDSLNYIKWSGNRNTKIYAFEPDTRNYEICKKNLNGYTNIKLFNIGLSDKEEELYMIGEGDMACLGRQGSLKISTKLLDNIIKNEAIGFIKMDVEGYEMNVLKGAEKIISNQHPILAISVYHKKSDIWNIPMHLLKLNENYHFYLRYYGAANGDTVLYACDCKSICETKDVIVSYNSKFL